MFIFVRAPGLKNKPSYGGRKTEKVYSTGMLYLFKSFEIKKKDERIKLVGRLIKCVCLLKMSQLSPAELALCVVRDIVVGPAVRSACRSLTSLLIISSIDLCLKRLSLLFGLSLLNVHGLRIFRLVTLAVRCPITTQHDNPTHSSLSSAQNQTSQTSVQRANNYQQRQTGNYLRRY